MARADKGKPLINIKLLIISVLIIFVLIIVLALVSVSTETKPLKLKNIGQIESGLSSQEISDLEGFIWQSLKDSQGFDDDKTGIVALVRPSSFIKTKDVNISNYDFLIDIDEFKATYQVSFALEDKKGFYESPDIGCPAKELMKYPDNCCRGKRVMEVEAAETCSETLPVVEEVEKEAYLDILVTPQNAQVKIDGVEYRNAIYALVPGTYRAEVTFKNLEPKIVELNLTKNQTAGLYLSLIDEAEWRQYSETEMWQKNSIAGVLPIYTSICGTPARRTNCNALKVEYERTKECDYNRCLIVSGRMAEFDQGAFDEIQAELAEKGYNLTDYQYIYKQDANR